MEKTSLFILLIVSVFAISCNTGGNKKAITASRELTIETAGSCPYLTTDNRNNIVVSWIKKVDTSTFIFCYAISEDRGISFKKRIEIPGSTNVLPHGENMPKVIFKPSGEIIAIWGTANPNPKNQYAGLVYYSQSFDQGSTWTNPQKITGDKASFDQRYFDLASLPNGEVAIVWLDNRKQWNNEGSGLYFAVTKGNAGFRNERLISGPCCQCCRTDLYIDRNSNIHVLYRAIINDSIRDLVHIVSTDRGNTFTQPKRISEDNWVISGCPHTGPSMTENNEGINFTWFTGGAAPGIYYNSSMDNGRSFTARDTVSGKAAKHCQITSLPNNNLIIVWNEAFVNGNAFSNRLGIEERDPKGNPILKEYITAKDSHSSFPVVCALNDKNALIAYTEGEGDKEHIVLRKVFL
jgi:hypothetical protein